MNPSEIKISTQNGEVSVLILVTDEDITIFFGPDCRVVEVEKADPADPDGVQVSAT